MSLEDIKNSIGENTQSQIKEIEAEGQKKINEINHLWSQKLESKKVEIAKMAKRKADQKVQKTEFSLQAQIQSEILNKKQDLISQAYKAALKKLTDLDDAKYLDLMEKLISRLPDDQGEVISVKGKESLLKKALKNSKNKITLSENTCKGQGGFLYQSKNIDMDFTFDRLVDDAKKQTILDVTNILFS